MLYCDLLSPIGASFDSQFLAWVAKEDSGEWLRTLNLVRSALNQFCEVVRLVLNWIPPRNLQNISEYFYPLGNWKSCQRYSTTVQEQAFVTLTHLPLHFWSDTRISIYRHRFEPAIFVTPCDFQFPMALPAMSKWFSNFPLTVTDRNASRMGWPVVPEPNQELVAHPDALLGEPDDQEQHGLRDATSHFPQRGERLAHTDNLLW